MTYRRYRPTSPKCWLSDEWCSANSSEHVITRLQSVNQSKKPRIIARIYHCDSARHDLFGKALHEIGTKVRVVLEKTAMVESKFSAIGAAGAVFAKVPHFRSLPYIEKGFPGQELQ